MNGGRSTHSCRRAGVCWTSSMSTGARPLTSVRSRKPTSARKATAISQPPLGIRMLPLCFDEHHPLLLMQICLLICHKEETSSVLDSKHQLVLFAVDSGKSRIQNEGVNDRANGQTAATDADRQLLFEEDADRVLALRSPKNLLLSVEDVQKDQLAFHSLFFCVLLDQVPSQLLNTSPVHSTHLSAHLHVLVVRQQMDVLGRREAAEREREHGQQKVFHNAALESETNACFCSSF